MCGCMTVLCLAVSMPVNAVEIKTRHTTILQHTMLYSSNVMQGWITSRESRQLPHIPKKLQAYCVYCILGIFTTEAQQYKV